MANNSSLKISLAVSFALHLAVFAAFALPRRTAIHVNVPVDVFFSYAPPALPQPPVPAQQIITPKKEAEIPLPVKKRNTKREKETKKKEDAPPAPKAAPAPSPAPSPNPAPSDAAARPLSPSAQISVDAVRFPYAYYTNRIVKKIGQHWQWTNEFGNLKTVLYFRIQRDGTILSVDDKKSSGDKMFDQQALRAVQLASPFPPLPQKYADDDLGVYFEFAFKQ